MRFFDLLRVSIRTILRHHRRYILVALTISLGVAGFIVVTTMSRDVKRVINDDLNLIGGVTIIKMSFENGPDQRHQWFRDTTVAALRNLPGVQCVSLGTEGVAPVVVRNRKYPVRVTAVDQFFWELYNVTPLSGAFFGGKAVSRRARELVVGEKLARTLFGTQEVVGQLLQIGNNLYRVVGVLGGIAPMHFQRSAFLPLTTAQDRLDDFSLANNLSLRCETWDDVPKVAQVLWGLIGHYQPTEGLQVEVLSDKLDRVKRLAWYIEFLVYLAVGATLILGGGGIWNVMTAAVRSRTREIGLKKAVGAEDTDILAEFLLEAVCISLGASLVGILLGRILIAILSFVIDVHPSETLFFLCLGLGLIFAVFLGVAAGISPSIQASRMELVSAIRYE